MAAVVTYDFTNGNVADADEVDQNFTDVLDELNLVSTDGKLALAIPPIGSILPWAKTLTGVPALPSGYVECDGSVLSDAGSLLNGQTIPDLNGSAQFVMGGSTSGATGGNNSMTTAVLRAGSSSGHVMYALTEGMTNGRVYNNGTFTDNDATDHRVANFDNRPAYYQVVWIMRVK